jgi:hypothetical protein
MRIGCVAQTLNRFDGERDRRIETETLIGSMNVVVHRFGHADARHRTFDAFAFGQTRSDAQSVVAANRDKRVEAELFHVFEQVR